MSETKSILVTGAHGQLGRSLKVISPLYSNYQFSFVSRDELDLSDADNIVSYFQHNHFDFIINCAAYTSVDKAEQEIELANTVNHIAVKKLAEIAKAQDSALIHISTDYVFDGTNCTPYAEIEQPNPQSIYGASKLEGEEAIVRLATKAIIIRTSWVYSEFGNNFVKTMLRLGKEREKLNIVCDQIGSPTRANDLALAIMKIVELNADQWEQDVEVPIYHYSNEGVCSWYDFAKTIFELANIPCNVSPIETKDYPTPAKRPHYSVLNKAKIKAEYGVSIPYWKDSLKECIATLQENSTV